MWVVEEGDLIIGFLALTNNEVGVIFLDPAHHGLKIDKLMMDKAKDLYGDLEVEVHEKNSIGRSFYSRFGFKLIEEKIHEPTGEKVLRLKYTAS